MWSILIHLKRWRSRGEQPLGCPTVSDMYSPRRYPSCGVNSSTSLHARVSVCCLVLADVERSSEDGEILEATLVAPDGMQHAVRNGCPRSDG